jgi:hypothetical protein
LRLQKSAKNKFCVTKWFLIFVTERFPNSMICL